MSLVAAAKAPVLKAKIPIATASKTNIFFIFPISSLFVNRLIRKLHHAKTKIPRPHPPFLLILADVSAFTLNTFHCQPF
jgi:hypothetical protein